MTQGQDDIRHLIAYRLEQSDDALSSAEMLLRSGLIKDSANRSYYAMFYAVLALLITKQLGSAKHSGVISMFDREFIKNGTLPRELSTWLHTAFRTRLDADYGEFIKLSNADATEILLRAGKFVQAVKDVLSR